jgi:hypothetical protein
MCVGIAVTSEADEIDQGYSSDYIKRPHLPAEITRAKNTSTPDSTSSAM